METVNIAVYARVNSPEQAGERACHNAGKFLKI